MRTDSHKPSCRSGSLISATLLTVIAAIAVMWLATQPTWEVGAQNTAHSGSVAPSSGARDIVTSVRTQVNNTSGFAFGYAEFDWDSGFGPIQNAADVANR